MTKTVASKPTTETAHTPGPWRWEVNRACKRVQLCGGPPKRGFGRYDLTVMDFRRWGMNSAAPVFWYWDYDKWVGAPQRADDLAVAAEGREHHADWFALIDHPDARLIAAAPELLEALRPLTMMARTSGGTPGPDAGLMAACEAAEAAIAKAKGCA
jgi:hypothetical protein